VFVKLKINLDLEFSGDKLNTEYVKIFNIYNIYIKGLVVEFFIIYF